MKKGFVTAVLTFVFCLFSASLFAETIEERLNRLESEIRDLRAQASQASQREAESEIRDLRAQEASQREAQLKELKAAAPAEKAVAAAPVPKQSVDNLVWTKYNMRLYGRIKVDLNYDTARFVKYNDFVGAVTSNADYKNDSTNFNPRDTRFGFEASHTDGDWTGLGRFEVDFYGSNTGDNAVAGNNLIPRMRLGYVNMLYNPSKTSILVGQDWIPVAQLNPNTVDFGILTAAGNLWWRVPQVTVRQELGDFQLLASAMKHKRLDTAEESRMPWVLGRVAYTGDVLRAGGVLDKGSLIALGGGYRTEVVAKVSPFREERIHRYLLAAELKLVHGPFTLQAEPWLGQGIGDEFMRYDLDVNRHEGGTAAPEAIWAVGGFVDLTYKATPKLSLAVGYGVDNPRDEDLRDVTLNDRQFTKNRQAFVNAWYQLTKGIKVGAEFINIETERRSETTRGNRYTLSTFYEF